MIVPRTVWTLVHRRRLAGEEGGAGGGEGEGEASLVGDCGREQALSQLPNMETLSANARGGEEEVEDAVVRDEEGEA